MQKQLQKLLLIMVTIFAPWISQAQSLGDYTFSTDVDTTKWIDMSFATQILTPSNNDALASSVQDIGFAFPFGDEDYTQYSVNTDGNLRLGHLATGTLNYSWPFDATNANNNNPKINAFGCDGYGLSGSHYVKSLLTVDANGDTMLVVEYCLGTYNSTTRSNLYKWQVHLYATGDIEMVYGAAPAAAPNIARQPGLCVNSSDGWTIDESHNATHFTAGVYNNTVSLGVWPTEGRYYRFASPSLDCPKPVAITASNIGTASFDISWTDTSTAASWIVRLFDGDSMIYDNEVFSNSASFTGLNAATYYAVQVAGLCTNGDTSVFQIVEVLTSCALLTSLPYTQNFDGVPGSSTERVSTNNLPPCWANYNAGTESNHSGHPIVYNNSIYAHSGTNAMRFYYYISWDTSDQIAIMPPTDSTVLPLSALQVSFWMRAHTDNHNSFIIVGVMSDPTNTGTFVPVDTVYTNSSMTYAQHTVLFSAYNGSHGSVAFRARGVNYLYIDDIVLDEIPTCLPVSNLMVTGVNDGSISLSWSPTGSETSWIVSDGTNDYMVSDTVYTLTGLSATTTYLISVRAYCGGDTSAAVAVTATTTCGVITALPFVENFDGVTGSTTTSLTTNNLPSCWSNYNTGTNTSYSGYPIVYSNSTYAHSGTNCMRFFNNGQAHFSDQIAVMPMTDSLTLPLQGLQVSFWLRDAGLNSLVVGVMTDPTDRTTFVAVDTISTNSSSTYGQHTVRLDSYNGPHGRVAFMAPQGSAGFVYNIFFIDDVVLESSVCQPVQNLTALNIAPNSVDVRWTETGSASTWYVTYMPVGYSLDSAITLVAHDTTVTITGLAANTDYTVMVVANCGSLTSDTGVVTFHTPCSYITSLPYVENFDGVVGSTTTSASTNNLPTCWYYHNTGTNTSYSGYPIVYNNTSNAHSGTNALRFYTYITTGTYSDQIAVMPQTDSALLPLSSMQVTFWMRSTSSSYNSYVVVGVMSDPTDASTFVSVDTVRTNGSTTYANYAVLFGRYAGPHGHVAFKVPQPASSYNALLIDDVVLDNMPTCPAVDDLTITYISTDTISIAWYPMGSETQWLVSDGTNEYVSTTASYTVGGLNSGTYYTLTVRAICDATGDTSDAVSVTTHTLCGFISVLPYMENFDSHVGREASVTSPDNNLPLCWRYINHGTRNNYRGYPIIYNSNAYSIGNCMRFYSHANYADSTHYAILPPTDSILFPINTLKISFYMRANSTSSSYKAEAIVGVITNPLNAQTFIPIDTVNTTGVTTYSRHEVSFENYNGFHGNIAMMFPRPPGSGINQNSGYIDDIVIEEIPDCMPATNLAAASTTDSTADLTWSDPAGYTSWRVEYGISGFIRGTGTVIDVSDTNVSLTGLTVNTAYDVYVTPNCSGGVAGVAFLTFRTACGTISELPYFEDFEAYNVGVGTIAPPDCGIPCWHCIDNSTQTHIGYIGNPVTWISGAHSGSRFLYYYFPPTGTAYPDWTISVLPPVNTDLHPVNTLRLSFWVKMSEVSASGNVVIGVMTDPTEDSTFVPVDTISVGGLIYDLKEVNLDSYTGNGAYIAMRFVRNPRAISYYFVDDITVAQIPFCPPVEYITLTEVDTTSLTVSWVEAGTATAWAVEYGVSGFTPGTGTGVMVRSLPFVMSGLTPATSYDIYITPDCLDGNTLTRTATFRTTNSYISVPFVCNFEDAALNAQWALENGANHNKWAIGTATSNGGTHSLYVSNDNGVSYSYTTDIADAVDYAFIDVTLPNAGDYGYTFDWKCEAQSLYDYMRVALIPASEMLTASAIMPTGLTLATMPSTWIPIDGGCKLNLHSTWQSRSDVAEITEPGAYHLAFIFRCDNWGGTQPPPAVDNITLAYSPCTRPDSVVLTHITQSAADFTWHEVGTANEWQYQLNNDTIITVYTNNASFTGLTANTDYTFRVRAVCGAGDTSFWRVYEFRTPCSYISIPYTQDFESESGGSSTTHNFAQCWTHLNNGIAYYGYPYILLGSGNHTVGGSNGVYWYNSTTLATYGDYQAIVLPPFDTTVDITTLQLSFWTKSSSNDYTPVFIVGVMTDPSNISTFEAVDTITFTGVTWREVVAPLSSYTGNGQFVAIKAERSTDYWFAYIDDVTLDYITTCFIPTIVGATNTTANSITLDWVDISPATQWQVEYGPQGYVRGSSAGTLLTTASHPVVIGGLDYLTYYDFYVRPICSAIDTARWGYPTTLMTSMCEDSLVVVTGYATSTGTNYRYPVNNFYSYSLTETIIDSAELGGEMDVEYISYYYDYATAMTHKENCTIYLQPTTLSTFSSASAAVALDPATAVRVYTGSLNCSEGWNYFLLDTVYHYDGTGNLLVIVDDNSSTYNSTAYAFKTHPCTGNKTLYYYSDSYNPDVMNPSSFAGNKYIDSSRVVMQLISCSVPHCGNPDVVSVSHTHESVTVTWAGDGNEYEVNIKEAGSTDWPVTDIHVTGNAYTFTGLMPTTSYTFRVRQDCTADTIGYSDWVVADILTDSMPCLPPDSLHVTAVTSTTATFDWEPVGTETMWDIHVWYSGDIDSIYTVSSHPATVGGLTAGIAYQASVRALCSDDHSIVGHWSNPILFSPATCPDVTGLSVANITANSVTLIWDSDPLAQSWIIEYGYHGFDLGTGITATTSDSLFVVSGLVSDMQYDFRVRAVCGDNWESEGWATVTATTLSGGVPCETPSNIAAEVSGNTATISWTASEYNIGFELEYGPHGFAHGDVAIVSVNESPFMLTGLDYETEYDFYVRAICDQDIYSEWSDVVSFTTESVGIDRAPEPICTIHPNPTSGSTTITMVGISGKVKIAVIDMDGREVVSETLDCSGDCAKSMNVENLAQGAYFVRITGENANMVRKLIVR